MMKQYMYGEININKKNVAATITILNVFILCLALAIWTHRLHYFILPLQHVNSYQCPYSFKLHMRS